MKSMFSTLVLSALFASSVLAQTETVNTPQNVLSCTPQQITWTGGTPPYILEILPGDDPSAAPLEQFGGLTGTSFVWNVDQPVGTTLGLTLKDANGTPAQSGTFTILAGPNTVCSSSSSSGTSTGSSGTGTAPTSTPTTTAPTSTPTGSTSTPTSPPTSTTHSSSSGSGSSTGSASHTSSGASTSSTSKSNAAQPTGAVHFGAAGVIGAAVLAILA